ncbi:MAG: hypothetical protein AAGC44_10170 [Planctomycetota bacterium]
MTSTTFTMPGADLDLADGPAIADVLHLAAEYNRQDPLRKGASVHLPAEGRLLMTGDLHDNTLGLTRIVKHARLDRKPTNRLVLHEIIHGPNRVNGMDLSIRTLARCCAVKCAYPEQVYMLLSNHELAQRRQEHVFKDSSSDVEAFNLGLEHLYANDAKQVNAAFEDYVDSLLLAVRCANGVFCSHSLPAPRDIEGFDKSVIDRDLTELDNQINGSAHNMVWGRHQNIQLCRELMQAWDCKVFLVGHQPAEMGHEELWDDILILNSDHSHAVCLPINLKKSYTRDELSALAVPLNAIPL